MEKSIKTQYHDLLDKYCPVYIETEDEYKKLHKDILELMKKQDNKTADETKMLRLLALIIKDYDERMN